MDKLKEDTNSNKKNRLSETATKIIKNSGWLVSDKVFTMIIGIFVTAIVARYFGPEDYGNFNYALSFVSLFTAISVLGLETLTIKSIVNKDNDEGTILCTSLFLRVLGGIILTILASSIIWIIERNDHTLYLLVLIMSSTMIFKSLEVIEYWIQAYQNAKISSIIRMSVYIISSALKILLVLLSGNLIHFAFIYAIEAILIGFSLLVAYFLIRREKSIWKFNVKYAKDILSQSWPLILSGLMVTLYMRIDQVMLGSILPSKSEVGVYSAAVRISEMWFFVPIAIITSFTPVIMKKKKEGDTSILGTVQLLYTLVAWTGIGFGIIIFLFSDIIITLLYGADYLKAADILSISIWAGTFAVLGSAQSIWLISEGLQKYSAIFIAIGALTNIILNFILIPSFGGFGAAAATLVSQILVVLIVPSFFKEIRISSGMIVKAFILRGLKKIR